MNKPRTHKFSLLPSLFSCIKRSVLSSWKLITSSLRIICHHSRITITPGFENFEQKMVTRILILFLGVSSQTFVRGQANFKTTGNYMARSHASIPKARGIIIDEAGDILVVSRPSRIFAVYQVDQVKTTVIVNKTELGLNHGIAYRNGFIYASSPTTVYRWPYTPGKRSAITKAEQVVIRAIPGRGHVTRSLIFDKNGLLYVSIGSGANVDKDSSRARIRRFDISNIPAGGIKFNTGVVFADGLRNEVGLAFDEDGVLWGVQNGADDLNRDDLGGNIHNTNPADEMTKFDQALGTNYGYPFCWTVDQLQNHNKGDQFAWPDFMNDGVHTDAWCRNVNNNRPPTLPLPAHYAPLGITFYDASACNKTGAFPCSMKGDAFVTFNGSWNREPAAGYKVVRIPINPATKLPTGEILDIMYEPNPPGCSRKCFTPVDLDFDKNGHLIVTADATSEVFRITYKN